tara:strand:+ start:285 stop:413 length:129 start_codon:yes stop_codon:yes gene_type:complete
VVEVEVVEVEIQIQKELVLTEVPVAEVVQDTEYLVAQEILHL